MSMNYDLAAHVWELGLAMNRVQQRAVAPTGWSILSMKLHRGLMDAIQGGKEPEATALTRLLVRARRQDGGTIQ